MALAVSSDEPPPTATIRSVAAAALPSAVRSPASASRARLAGVPIMAAARATPGTASMSRVRRMRVTESWYALFQTKLNRRGPRRPPWVSTGGGSAPSEPPPDDRWREPALESPVIWAG